MVVLNLPTFTIVDNTIYTSYTMVDIDSTTSTALKTVSNLSLISQFNRGPVTTTVDIPASCTATLTYGASALYYGHHYTGYFDSSCIPVGTQKNLESQNWDNYYCRPTAYRYLKLESSRLCR